MPDTNFPRYFDWGQSPVLIGELDTCITGPDGEHACYANGEECLCACNQCRIEAEPENKYMVMMESEIYGREFFAYDTLGEALAGIERLHNEAMASDAVANANGYDGIERVIGLVLNHNPASRP